MMTTEALAAALDVVAGNDDGDWRLVLMSTDGGLDPSSRGSQFAGPVSAALAEAGYAIVRSDELERLRAIEAAARATDPREGWAITSKPAIDALRAALEAP